MNKMRKIYLLIFLLLTSIKLFAQNFVPGSKRGDKTHKDSYMTMSLSYSYVIRGRSSFYRGHYGGFFGKGKGRGKSRKIRAKF